MSQDNGQLLVASIVGFGGGLYMFAKGFREFRKYRVVADTPEMPIRSIPMGLVHIRGRACGEATLVSPVTHTPCYVFKVVVEQWHSDSEGGGEWKNVATDVQSVMFDLEDNSARVRVDAKNAELDLPSSPVREVRSHDSRIAPSVPTPGTAVRGAPATDSELLQYVEQARVHNVAQMVGKGISLMSHGNDPAREPQRQSFLNTLTNPGGVGAVNFQAQLIKAMIMRRDPTGEFTRLALEVWRHPQGSAEFEAALVRFSQAYSRAMAPTKRPPDPAEVLAQVRQHPQVLGMVAIAAASADPQSDPMSEKARQAALAYQRDHAFSPGGRAANAPSGHFRFTESCLLPGQNYNITGTCVENPQPRHEHDRNLILKGSNEPTFLISSKSEKQVESSIRKRAALMVLGGAALAVVCLAIFLGITGLL